MSEIKNFGEGEDIPENLPDFELDDEEKKARNAPPGGSELDITTDEIGEIIKILRPPKK